MCYLLLNIPNRYPGVVDCGTGECAIGVCANSLFPSMGCNDHETNVELNGKDTNFCTALNDKCQKDGSTMSNGETAMEFLVCAHNSRKFPRGFLLHCERSVVYNLHASSTVHNGQTAEETLTEFLICPKNA